MSLPPKPSFRKTPSKTTTFVVNSCRKPAFLEVQTRFPKAKTRFCDLLTDPKKAADK